MREYSIKRNPAYFQPRQRPDWTKGGITLFESKTASPEVIPFIYQNWVPSPWFSSSVGTYSYAFMRPTPALVCTTHHINLHRPDPEMRCSSIAWCHWKPFAERGCQDHLPCGYSSFLPSHCHCRRCRWLCTTSSKSGMIEQSAKPRAGVVHLPRWVEGVLPQKHLRKLHRRTRVRNTLCLVPCEWGSVAVETVGCNHPVVGQVLESAPSISQCLAQPLAHSIKDEKQKRLQLFHLCFFYFPAGENLFKVLDLLNL